MTVVLGLRYALGGARRGRAHDTQTHGRLQSETVVSLAEAVNQPSLTRWPVLAIAMIGPVVLWLLANRAPARSVSTSADARPHAGISVFTLWTGLASELRRHLPALAVLLDRSGRG